MFRTIRWKLILSISVPLLVTYLGMLAWDYYRQRKAAMEQMQAEVLDRAESIAANLDARLSGVMQAGTAMAGLIENRPNVNAQQLQTTMLLMMRRNPWVSSLIVATEPGSGMPALICRRGAGDRLNVIHFVPSADAQQAVYSDVKRTREPAWSAPYEDAPRSVEEGRGGRRVATYATPLVINEEFRGVVAVSVAVDELRQRLNRPPPRVAPSGRGARDGGGGAGGRDGGGGGGGDRNGPRGRPGAGDGRPGDGDGDDRGRGGGTRESPPPAPRGPASMPGDDLRGPQPPLDPPPDETPAGELPAAVVRQVDDFGIFDAAGRPVVVPAGQTPPRETIFQTAESAGHPEVAQAAREALAGQSHVVRVTSLQKVLPNVPADDAHWIAFAPIPATGWAIVSVIPESTAMAPLLARIAQRGAFLLGGTLVLLMVVMLVSIKISRPIEHLAGAVDRLAAGDMDAQVTSITGRDELARLADGFNHMTRQLKAHIAALTEQSAAREKVESELRIARQIQTDMLPKTFPPFPDRPEFDLHAVNLPALRVAGDFYDFFFTPRGVLTIVIADVSGKGVPAALLMAVTRTIVRNLGMSGLSPREMAERANAMLIADTSRGMFVTMLLCQYDPATGKLAYVNAGHPPPYRFAPGVAPKRCCDVQSPLLGVDGSGEMGAFEECEETLAPGESIFLFTDGVPDARATDGTSFGEGGLLEALRDRAALPPEGVARGIAEHLDRFQAGQRHDDITLVVLRRSGAAQDPPRRV